MGAPYVPPTTEELIEVAAIVTGWPSRTGFTPAIAKRFGLTQATAHRWVLKARGRGYLPDGSADRPCRHCGGTGVTRWGATRRTSE